MKLKLALAIGAALCLAIPAPALAEDNNCPDSVKKAVEKSFPGSHVKKCEVETDDGKTTYEVKLKTKEGAVTRMNLDHAGVAHTSMRWSPISKSTWTIRNRCLRSRGAGIGASRSGSFSSVDLAVGVRAERGQPPPPSVKFLSWKLAMRPGPRCQGCCRRRRRPAAGSSP